MQDLFLKTWPTKVFGRPPVDVLEELWIASKNSCVDNPKFARVILDGCTEGKG
jgi:hypothetical protein